MFARPSASHRRGSKPGEWLEKLREFLAAYEPSDIDELDAMISNAKRSVQGVGTPREVRIARGGKIPLELTSIVPCRKCSVCLRLRAKRWRVRGQAETRALHATNPALRVWWSTFTFTAENHYQARCMAVKYAQSRSVKFDELSPRDQVSMMLNVRHGLYGRALDRYFKRLRKGTSDHPGASFRYLVVCELHRGGGPSDGNVHIHIIFWETDDTRPLRHSALRSNWWGPKYQLGFCRFKMIPAEDVPRVVSYVCNYVTKSADARIRASKNFGNGNSTTKSGSLAERGALHGATAAMERSVSIAAACVEHPNTEQSVFRGRSEATGASAYLSRSPP